MAAALAVSIDPLSDVQIVVHIGNGNVAFLYPAPKAQSDIEADKAAYIHEFIVADGRRSDSIAIPASTALARDSYVGWAVSSIHALETSVSLSKDAVIASFVWDYWAQMASLTDELTQIRNRRAFDTEFPKLWKSSMRAAQPISALFIDIDHFKIFNDEYGHDHGDDALVAVAHAIVTCANRPLDLCCRWGGEEFAVVLPDTDEQGAIYLANMILAAVRAIRLDFGEGKSPKITVSIGIASIVVTEGSQTEDLIDMADKAMYVAKQSGRDRYAIHGKPGGR